MIKQIRTSKFSKVVACYLAMMIFLEMLQPMQLYALTSGPSQPEFNAFTPISTSDMVNLATGDFNYNIPIMDVGGYPLNLTYNSGITMDQEASWTGLGWNLNVGQIQRDVRGLPDDFKGDPIRYENDVKQNITVGSNFNFHPAVFGFDFISAGLGVQYNNYEGITFKPSFGISYELGNNTSVGVNFASSVGEGATVSPSVSLSKKMSNYYPKVVDKIDGTGTLGLSFNSRKGLSNLNISVKAKTERTKSFTLHKTEFEIKNNLSGGVGGSISLNNTNNYTPTKRVGYENLSFTFDAALGTEVFGMEAQGQVTGYGSYQSIKKEYKNRLVRAFGYENTEAKGSREGILDFNRENEQTISENTLALPVTNYTYDTYFIEGQGISGMFRPYRSQVTHVYNDEVSDDALSMSFGVEIGVGNLAHGGVNFLMSPSTSSTGNWTRKNNAINSFKETSNPEIAYEPVAFKMVGEPVIDKEATFYENMHKTKPVRIKLDRKWYNNTATNTFAVKNNNNANDYSDAWITPIKRTERYVKNQVVQKITAKDALNDPFIEPSSYAKPHHTAGIKILKTDGSTYVYGKSVYNTKKIEATFDVSAKSNSADLGTGLLSNIHSVSGNHANNSDQFLNRITTPAYAHTYLLTSLLSTDYEDIDGNGLTHNDLGSFTKFEYQKMNNGNNEFKWRIPYRSDQVSFNEGLKSNSDDEKGNYVYGEKEQVYLKRIITKTHVAIFELSKREDARGASQEIGPEGTTANKGYSYKIDKIKLYSYPEAKAANLLNDILTDDKDCVPIKTAHFTYDYSLCLDTPNNFGTEKGKLTLKKLYFTYRDSKMGMYTPYVFGYSNNKPYSIKGFDIWGNYKENVSVLNNAEFPFVQQDFIKAKENTEAWQLKTIKLPSGGELTVDTESDDYQYVQNKKAMQMFMVEGAGNTQSISEGENFKAMLYDNNNHNSYLYVNLGPSDNVNVIDGEGFKNKYLSELNDPIYFRFLLNMTNNNGQEDFVNGYFKIGSDPINVFQKGGNTYVALPVKKVEREGGTGANKLVNPIAKSGWSFGRMYLNRIVYSIGGNSSNTNFVSIVKDLVGSIAAISELWKGPNKALQDKGCAKKFNSQKSWVRLTNPDGHKYGGGSRVKSISLSDNWNVMMAHENNNLYKQSYGQVYDYNLPDKTSSGVATYEPNSSAENPFVKPFYPNSGNYENRIAAPKDQNYIEEPFGEAFFPSPMVTYSRVTVSNIPREHQQNKLIKHATGSVVTEYYTSRDFPTQVDYTNVDMAHNIPDPFASFVNIISINHLVATQGYSIVTNDMNGKTKAERIYGEGDTEPISQVEYKYNVGPDGKLNNQLTTIDKDGKAYTDKQIGVDYDMVNDFNESNSTVKTFGFDANIAAFLVAIFPVVVPVVLPKFSYQENILRTAVTTKVVHQSGLLVEKIVTDSKSVMSTKNLAWDANTGQVLLTRTSNEFNDMYYNFSYPAYWAYDGMGMAYENIGLKGKLKASTRLKHFDLISTVPYSDISKYFKIGDELILENTSLRLWVSGYSPDKKSIQLMKANGFVYEDRFAIDTKPFRLVRSGYRNMQMASMASVVSMQNPIDLDGNGGVPDHLTENTYVHHELSQTDNPRIVSASAIEYRDVWRSQCEFNLPSESGYINGVGDPVNPFIYNIQGDWRPSNSYAYLTGRNNFSTSSRRKVGFFDSFNPFYMLQDNEWVLADDPKWQYASEVTKYNPFGVELENKDALDRYSSAQYGYKYTLPVAVVSNAAYREIGYDGFEDYDEDYFSAEAPTGRPHFGFSDIVSDKAYITNEKAHTGRNSIAIESNAEIVFKRKVNGCQPQTATAVLQKTIKKRVKK